MQAGPTETIARRIEASAFPCAGGCGRRAEVLWPLGVAGITTRAWCRVCLVEACCAVLTHIKGEMEARAEAGKKKETGQTRKDKKVKSEKPKNRR